MALFDKAFEIVVGAEGGYVNNPKDPGGETKYGVCKRSYPNVDIKNLTLAQAKEIYKRDYWVPIEADKLHDRLAIFYFDCAINQGMPTAKKLMQRHLGLVDDGVIGAKTREAMSKVNKARDNEFMTLRAQRYVTTANFDVFGKGWFNRLFSLSLLNL